MEAALKILLDNAPSVVLQSRSRAMRAIKSKNNKATEMAMKMLLVRLKIQGWKLHAKLPGTPDFFFPSMKLALFVDGCFWHACPSCGHTPKTRSAFWSKKFELNRLRDVSIQHQLETQGIRVHRVWEHEFRDIPSLQRQITDVLRIRD
jgi:DNA mismatch endonuclease (patch repair protein)